MSAEFYFTNITIGNARYPNCDMTAHVISHTRTSVVTSICRIWKHKFTDVALARDGWNSNMETIHWVAIHVCSNHGHCKISLMNIIKKQNKPIHCGTMVCYTARQVTICEYFDFHSVCFHVITNIPTIQPIYCPWNVYIEQVCVYSETCLNDHLMGYLSAFWSSSRWSRAT